MTDQQVGALTPFDSDAVYPIDGFGPVDQTTVNAQGPWDYQFELAKGVWTFPEKTAPVNRPEEHHLPFLAKHLFGGTFKGLRILDLGCNFGHFSLKAAELQAHEVVGVELRESNLKRAAFARASRKAHNVSFLKGRIEDVTKEQVGEFDVVILAGVFFHLTQPMQVLENVFSVAKHGVLIDTNIVPALDGVPILRVSSDDPSKRNWGVRTVNFQPSVPALLMMVEAAGFQEMLEMPITNEPLLRYGMWLDHRNPYKVRRQVFYAFKRTADVNEAARNAFVAPWTGEIRRTKLEMNIRKLLKMVLSRSDAAQ